MNTLPKIGTGYLLIAALLVTASPATKADDFLESIEQLRLKDSQSETRFQKLKWSNEVSELEIYGQLNKGVLIYDDGVSTKTYFPVDSDKNSSRLGIWLRHYINDAWTVAGNVEFQWAPFTTRVLSTDKPGKYDWNDSTLRKAEALVTSPYGKLWFGQGSMASDNTSEADLSGSSVTGSSSVSDTASERTLRLSTGQSTDIRIDDVFRNFDGLGRKLRIRYDSPSWNGLVLGVSFGEKVLPEKSGTKTWDISAKYIRTFGDYDITGAVAFIRPGRDSKGALDGSFSVFNAATGLSFTVAGAFEAHKVRDLSYIYGKIGYRSYLFDWGSTVLSADAYYGDNIGRDGSVSKSFGFQAVQNVDYWRTEAYFSLRSYDYDERQRNFKKSLASLIGLRFKF